jgi:hypothetical protein
MQNLTHTKCPTCGSNTTGRWERLTPGIVRSLIKMWQVVHSTNKNSVHLQQQCDFSKNEYNNFQKLRYFGLVRPTGARGRWLITRRGGHFIHGRAKVNAKLLIFQNGIKDRSSETVDIYQVLKQLGPTWPRREDFFAELPLIDAAEQGGLFA